VKDPGHNHGRGVLTVPVRRHERGLQAMHRPPP
jgi:hypothetical protein